MWETLLQSALQWSFVFLLLVNLWKTTGMNYLEDLELGFPETRPFWQDSSTPWGDVTPCQYIINAQIRNMSLHTSLQVYTISASMRYGHTTNQTRSVIPKISTRWKPWCWIQRWWFLTVDQANKKPFKSPDGLTSTRCFRCSCLFSVEGFCLLCLRKDAHMQPHWNRPCIEPAQFFGSSYWSYCLDRGWCQLHNLDHIFVMQNMVFATHLSQGDVKQVHRTTATISGSMWSVLLTRHLELRYQFHIEMATYINVPSIRLSWPSLSLWVYDKEHEFCGPCPSHPKTKRIAIPVDLCWSILDQPDYNTLQQPGLGRLLHAAAPHKGVLKVFQQGFWVNMRYCESDGTMRNDSRARIDDNWTQDSV